MGQLLALVVFLSVPTDAPLAPAPAETTLCVSSSVSAEAPAALDECEQSDRLARVRASNRGPEAPTGSVDDAAPGRDTVASPLLPPALKAQAPAAIRIAGQDDRFDWNGALRQSLTMLAFQHAFRMTEDKTRRELPGPFFRDWFDSIKSLHGWKDGGRQFTNYVAHPMQGALYGYVYVHNSPTSAPLEFGKSGAYWKSRMKAMGWIAIWSTQFELGPISQASIGNVGAGKYEAKKMAYVDLVITPTLGAAWIVAEDLLDRHVAKRIEAKVSNRWARAIVRIATNPMRAGANALRFKVPWHRDNRSD
jgi:hypothetical protein